MKHFPIHNRINLLLYTTGFIFLFLLLRLYLTTSNQEKLILKESELQFQNEINALIANKQETLNQVVYDYTFWNEFVTQVNFPDTAWYTNNITTILKSFRVDYVAVYDSTFHLIHEVSIPSVTSRTFVTEEILNKIKEVRILDFFQIKPEGLFDVSTASIHPDNDPTHMLTRPSGYLILAKNWAPLLTSSESRLGGAIATLKLATDSIEDKGEYLTTASVHLHNWDKREFGYERKGKFLEFFVKDTGVGIRQDKREMIFERFRQVSESLSRNYEGAGLGLAISKAFVEIMGGRIWVESELGEGSSFFFAIPFVQQKIVKTSPFSNELNRWEKLNIRGLKIVIAEDDAISDLLLSKLIKSIGREVLKVKTGTDVVDVCRKNPDVDLVLMDIQMPEMNGYEATRRIRKFNKNLIIIAQTALSLKGEREKALESGCTDYLTKPFSVVEFNELIRKYFES